MQETIRELESAVQDYNDLLDMHVLVHEWDEEWCFHSIDEPFECLLCPGPCVNQDYGWKRN